jgi:uncharacterized protein
MVGAFAGAKLASFLSGPAQLVLLAVVMLAAAGSMLRRGRDARGNEAHAGTPQFVLLAAIALAVGALTGLVGIGGGFLIVPALVLLARVPMREAVGTSLLVIAMNSASGFAGYVGTVDLDWRFLAGFTAVAIVGALAGTALAARVPQVALKRAFAVLLLAVGGFVLYQNRGALRALAVSPAPSSPSSPAPVTATVGAV